MNSTQQEQQKIYCRYQCGTEITLDKGKSRSGKAIPIEVHSGLPHECAKSPYALAHTSHPVAQVQGKQQPTPSVEIGKEVEGNKLTEIKGQLYEIIAKLDDLKKSLAHT